MVSWRARVAYWLSASIPQDSAKLLSVTLAKARPPPRIVAEPFTKGAAGRQLFPPFITVRPFLATTREPDMTDPKTDTIVLARRQDVFKRSPRHSLPHSSACPPSRSRQTRDEVSVVSETPDSEFTDGRVLASHPRRVTMDLLIDLSKGVYSCHEASATSARTNRIWPPRDNPRPHGR